MSAPAAFHEVVFPFAVALGATGGPERLTEIVALASGAETRNARWADSRRRYDVGTGLRSLDDVHALVAFFEERRGRLHGFRFRDPADDRSGPPSAEPTPLDQPLGTGDGVRTAFPLAKRYGGATTGWTRPIAKPVAGTVRVAVAGAERTAGTQFTVDVATGIVTFLAGHVPPPGAAVTAGFRFHVPVRFDTDRLVVDLAAFAAGDVPDVPLVEIRP